MSMMCKSPKKPPIITQDNPKGCLNIQAASFISGSLKTKMNTSKHIKHNNQVRIIGGQLRGRKIHFANAQGLRPTPDMVREKLFNWLGQDLTGQKVLDLFSGSGALGFEAASRHAKSVVLCDNNRISVQNVQQHTTQFQLNDVVQIVCQDAFFYLQSNQTTFDLIFLDPPFAWQNWAKLFELLLDKVKPDSHIYIEAETLPTLPEWLFIHRQGKAGKSHFILAKVKHAP